MEQQLTPEQKLKALDFFFMDDYEFDARYVAEMTEEEYECFLLACPEFLQNSKWAQEYEKERNKKRIK